MMLLLSLSMLTTLSLWSATYYASPTGSGNGNTYATPCSLANGLKKLKNAGDTLYLLAGQYDLGTTSIQNLNGTAARRIVISGYPGQTAILDFRTTAYGKRGLEIKNTCTYLHLYNLTLRYSGKNNLYNEGSYCLFENLDIYGSADTGCQMKNGGYNTIKNVDSHDNCDYELGGLTAADFGGNADGFADKQHSGAPNTYIGCRAWNNSDDGWDFFQRNTSAYTEKTVIENCICYQNGPAYYDFTNHGRYQTDKSWFDQFAGNGRSIVNADGETKTCSLSRYVNEGNGNGFKLGGDYTTHNVLIHHCLAVGNTVKGFDQNNNAGTMYCYNNSGYRNRYNYGFHNSSYGTLYIRNCLSLSSSSKDQLTTKTVAANDHNSWNTTGVSCTAADFLSTDTTQFLTPRLADGSLAQGTLLRLATGSDLIDAGVDVGLDFTGSAPDLGCYETDGVLRPSVVCTSGNSEQWLTVGDSIVPIVFEWGGSATRLTCSAKPEGIEHKISNNNHTLTLSGAPTQSGTFTITVTTVSADAQTASLTAVLHVKGQTGHRIAYVTLPGSSEDAPLLLHLRASDSLTITETDATDNTIDYRDYEVIVLGSKPNSAAAGLAALEGYNKPMLLLKPFLLKNTVWNWGTAVNTSDLSITVSQPEHPLFNNLTLGDNNTLQLFTQCNTNAVTAISQWTGTAGFDDLASPVSQATYTTIADMPAGTDCNGTVLPQRLVMIGLSEYSTIYLTDQGKQLVENAIYYLLGIDVTTGLTAVTPDNRPTAVKQLTPQGLRIIVNGHIYTATGQLLNQQ
ncbi:MAG: hypothetical protein IJ581_07775 [Paludibacteraceae bacterium]|nr:hypothetical protein [Paludibacteraceae bacterium]